MAYPNKILFALTSQCLYSYVVGLASRRVKDTTEVDTSKFSSPNQLLELDKGTINENVSKEFPDA